MRRQRDQESLRGKSDSAGPERRSLNVGAWNPQESGRKAPLSCNAAFSLSHRSSSLAAAQLLVKLTSALQKSECCSAASAAQHSENCSATSLFRLWHVAGVGFGGVGLRTSCNLPLRVRGSPKGPQKTFGLEVHYETSSESCIPSSAQTLNHCRPPML